MSFADRVSKICLDKFENIPKTGKPVTGQEWTVLSCIVKYDESNDTLETVSLGTGTKCIGSNQLSQYGDIINDSHAEIMARRGLLRYIYNELKKVLHAEQCSIFDFNDDKTLFQLKKGINFHFFTTHSPCGDASIFSLNNTKRDLKQSTEEPKAKKFKISLENEFGDIIYTGAKLLEKNKDAMSQDECKIRIKPGRGIKTLSVSCSDKLSRWNIIGCQGALLSAILTEPIYLKTITFCFNADFDKDSLERALWRRWDKDYNNYKTKFCQQFPMFIMQKPKIFHTADANLSFKYCKNDQLQPSPASIVWCLVDEKPLEVAINGKKQGVTKKKLHTKEGRLKISKVELLSEFYNLLDCCNNKNTINNNIIIKLFNKYNDNNKNYNEIKNLSINYKMCWEYIKHKYFQLWTIKSDNLIKFKCK